MVIAQAHCQQKIKYNKNKFRLAVSKRKRIFKKESNQSLLHKLFNRNNFNIVTTLAQPFHDLKTKHHQVGERSTTKAYLMPIEYIFSYKAADAFSNALCFQNASWKLKYQNVTYSC